MKTLLGFKGWMAEHGVTQREIADLLEISNTAAHQKVNGRIPFSLKDITKICEKYHISADIFLPKEL